MNRRYMKTKRTSIIQNILRKHIESNLRNYIIMSVIFLIGIIIGVLFINNTSDSQFLEINNYISMFLEDIKMDNDINEIELLKDSINKNVILVFFVWFMSATIIGILVVYLTICFRGFCLGYTISSIILSLRYRKRNYNFNINNFITEYIVYTLHNGVGRKWSKNL